MNTEIVYVCNSTNNKNVRGNELEILRKFEDKLYFEFGETENNIKKRYYNDIQILNKDFEAIEKIKNKLKKEEKQKNQEIVEEFVKENFNNNKTLNENLEQITKEIKEKYNSKSTRRKNIF